MGYNWEFNDTVEFAPQNYRLKKYEECEKIGQKMIEQQSEESAELFLDKFKYVNYLAEEHINEIKNWQSLVGLEEMALTLLQSDNAIFKWIIYPQQTAMWRMEFDELREAETQVSTQVLKQLIYQFNKKYKKLNEQNQKYHHRKHTLYWIKNPKIKKEVRKLLDYEELDKKERFEYLQMYGAVDTKIDWR